MLFFHWWYNALNKVNTLPRTGTNAFLFILNRAPHGLSHADSVFEDHDYIAHHKHEHSSKYKSYVALPGCELKQDLLLPLVNTVL